MKAAVLHRFGRPEEFKIEQMPVPEITANEVLIKLNREALERHYSGKLILKNRDELFMNNE